MAKPTTTEIQALYTTAAQGGLSEDEVDAIAVPMIDRMGYVSGLGDVRSQGELRTIAAAVAETIATRTVPAATERQVSYAVSLGADAATVTTMSRHDASALIDQLKGDSVTGAGGARLAGARHGVRGEIWD